MTLLHLTMTQKIQIQNLKTNPGILPFKLGSTRIKVASHTFLHYINLDPLQTQITSITNHYYQLEHVINNSNPIYRPPLYGAYKHLEYEVKIVTRKIYSLLPENRAKRGLINPLGSLVKFISGNLDQEDAKEIHDSISQLETNQNKIVRKINKQLSITSKLMENINETMTTVTSNQKSIANRVENLRETLNQTTFNYVHFLEIHEILNQIKLNLDSLLNFLSETENAISFAHLKTLHHSIITPNDLKEIVKDLQKTHSYSQLLFSNEEYLKYYSVVETNVYLINKKIIFSLDFPLVHPDIFNYYHLYSVPNQNQSIIIPPSTYLILSNDQYQYQDEECASLEPNFLCKKNHLLTLQENSDCITSLLSVTGNSNESCRRIPVHTPQLIIEEINEAHYIGIFPDMQKVQTNCEENEVALLRGAYLFVLPPNCSINTQKYTYRNAKGLVTGHPVKLENIEDIKIPILQTVKRLKLDRVSLDQLHQIQLQEEQEEPLDMIHLNSNYSRWSLWIVSFLSTCILIYTILMWRNKVMQICKKKPQVPKRNKRAVDETQVVPPSSSV